VSTLDGARPAAPGDTGSPPWTPSHLWAGHRRPGSGPRLVDRHDPATDEWVGAVACGGEWEVGQAVESARRAAAGWAGTAAEERAAVLREAAERVGDRREELATRQVIEMGKKMADALGGVDAAVGTIRQFAELGPLHRGRTLQGDPSALDGIRHVPRGVAAVVTPWNDPVAIAAQGIAANLAAGNTVVCKPSERAAFSVDVLIGCFEGAPEGVVNLVHGDAGTGAALVDEDVDVVVLTGSVESGRSVAQRCSSRFVHTVLELGGNDALVVDAGVDPRWAAEQIAVGAFSNAGQICVAVERVFVHRSLSAALVDELSDIARSLRTGHGFDPDTDLGPLVDRAHREHVHGHVVDATRRGARCAAGGRPGEGPGAFYPATVLVDVPEDARMLREETFGPVVPVVPVDDYEDALERAASSAHGLAATVLTGDMAHAQMAGRALPVGTVKVNAPFGGAPGGSADPHGVSGTGLGYGPGLLDELTRQRVFHLAPAPW
jgi:acyl-CoA reductase-like NAD-dependent aldehyde dehydrogenase